MTFGFLLYYIYNVTVMCIAREMFRAPHERELND